MTVIKGFNNQGKSNCLEAIFFLLTGKSITGTPLDYLINESKSYCQMGLDFISNNGNDERLYMTYKIDGTAVIEFKDAVLRRHSAVKDVLATRYLSADVLHVFQESPDFRRRYLDQFCNEYYSQYPRLLKRYEGLIKQKNRALKDNFSESDIQLFNQQLVPIAAEIVKLRQAALVLMIAEISTECAEFFSMYTDTVYVNYKISSHLGESESYTEWLAAKLSGAFIKEKRAGYSLYGPQRDDFVMMIGDKPMMYYLSRGMNRIMAILLTLAQLKLLSKVRKCLPVLLLDDVFAELDIDKKHRLMTVLVSDMQVVYTTVLSEDLGLLDHENLLEYEMKNGTLEAL